MNTTSLIQPELRQSYSLITITPTETITWICRLSSVPPYTTRIQINSTRCIIRRYVCLIQILHQPSLLLRTPPSSAVCLSYSTACIPVFHSSRQPTSSHPPQQLLTKGTLPMRHHNQRQPISQRRYEYNLTRVSRAPTVALMT